jgi:hypothetical protein
MPKLSKVTIPNRYKDGKTVETWFFDESGREFCGSVRTFEKREDARQFLWQQFLKFCEPEVYQGMDI